MIKKLNKYFYENGMATNDLLLDYQHERHMLPVLGVDDLQILMLEAAQLGDYDQWTLIIDHKYITISNSITQYHKVRDLETFSELVQAFVSYQETATSSK